MIKNQQKYNLLIIIPYFYNPFYILFFTNVTPEGSESASALGSSYEPREGDAAGEALIQQEEQLQGLQQTLHKFDSISPDAQLEHEQNPVVDSNSRTSDIMKNHQAWDALTNTVKTFDTEGTRTVSTMLELEVGADGTVDEFLGYSGTTNKIILVLH